MSEGVEEGEGESGSYRRLRTRECGSRGCASGYDMCEGFCANGKSLIRRAEEVCGGWRERECGVQIRCGEFN